MKRLFASAWMACFSLLTLVVLLQFVPGINFFFSFFGPSYWSILLVNIGFLSMAADGFAAGGRRALKIIPVFWFGGYLVVAGLSHWLAHQFYSQLDSQNRAQKIEWSPANDTIALSHSWSDENRAVTFTAENLIRDYPLDSALDGAVTGAVDAPTGYRQVKITIGDCPKGLMNEGPDGTRVVRTSEGRVQFANSLCISRRQAFAPGSTIKFVNGGIESSDLILARDIEPIAVSAANGRTYRLQAGWTRPLTWLPQPIIGCDWPGFTQQPLWCGIRFNRESARESGRTPEKVITAALGLHKVALEKRFPGLIWEDMAAHR